MDNLLALVLLALVACLARLRAAINVSRCTVDNAALGNPIIFHILINGRNGFEAFLALGLILLFMIL